MRTSIFRCLYLIIIIIIRVKQGKPLPKYFELYFCVFVPFDMPRKISINYIIMMMINYTHKIHYKSYSAIYNKFTDKKYHTK